MKSTPLGLLILFTAAAAIASPIIRDPGAIYLSDFDERPLRLNLVRAAPCYFDIGMERYAGTLRFPQTVKVEAFAEHGCRIRGNARQGGVAAWIPYEELEPLPEGLLENLRAAEERRTLVEDLISQGEIAIGMTADEIKRSVGRPQKRSKSADKSSIREVWEYIRYQLVPQTTVVPGFSQTIVQIPGGTNNPAGVIVTGNPGWTTSTIYVKVPVGRLAVTFENGIVEEISESEGTLAGGQVSIVAPPLEVYW